MVCIWKDQLEQPQSMSIKKNKKKTCKVGTLEDRCVLWHSFPSGHQGSTVTRLCVYVCVCIYVLGALLVRWAGLSRRAAVVSVPCESCREQANEVSRQLTALCHCPWVAMPQIRSCSESCLFFVSAPLCPWLWATKESLLKKHYSVRWMRHSVCLHPTAPHSMQKHSY